MMTVHPVANLFPPMSADAYESLKSDIATNGVREAAWTHKGQLIDGRHRARACDELGIKLPTREWDGSGSLVAFVVSLNLHRRDLTSSQKATVAVDVEKLLADEAKERQRAAGVERAKSAEREPKTGQVKKSQLPELIPEAGAGSFTFTCPSCHQQYTKASGHVCKEAARANESRKQAAKIVGTNPRYVSDAKVVKEKAPKLFEKVRTGELTLPQAKQEVRREEKRQQLEERAEEAEEQLAEVERPWDVITGDSVAEVAKLAAGSVDLVFADPPYNIGFDYGHGHDDSQSDAAYLAWCDRWLGGCVRALSPTGTLWALINDEYAAEYNLALKRFGLTVRNWVIWYETFGVNCSDKFNRTKRHLFYCVKDARRFTFHRDAVSRPSDRQAKYGDARANPEGKLLDDVWTDIPRLVGTAAERVPDFPTQLPLALLRRVIACCSNPGELVLDPFNGSGTTGVAAVQLGRRYVGFERNPDYAERARQRLLVAQVEGR